MSSLESKIKEVIEQRTEKSNEIKRFENASDKYKKLVNDGLTSQRGYNLMSINDARKINYDING